MNVVTLLGSTMGLGFVSGLNLYAAVLTVGLGIRLGLIHPHAGLSHLEVLTNPYVLGTAGVLYAIEFIADKVPWVDSLWDSVHTLIRPLGAAALGATALGSMDPATKSVLMLIAGGVALSSHSTKAGTRVAVNHSPEPFSNIALSLFEDGVAMGGTWLAVTHPVAMLVIVTVFLVFFAALSPKIFRLLRVEYIAVRSMLNRFSSAKRGRPGDLVEPMPERYAAYWRSKLGASYSEPCVRCVAGKGVRGLRNSVGYLHQTRDGLVFLTRRLFRFRTHKVGLDDMRDLRFKKGLLLDRISWLTGGKQQTFLFFKHGMNHGQEVFDILRRRTAPTASGGGS